MTRGVLLSLTSAVIMAMSLAGCGGGDDGGDPAASEPTASASPTTNEDEKAVIAAYSAFLAEKQRIQNSGKVPSDAYLTTLAPVRIEKERAIAKDYAEDGLVRVGKPEVKDAEVVDLTADKATLLVCENEDAWGFKPKGQEVQYPEAGWTPRGMEVVKVDERWVVGDALDQDRLPAKDCAA